MARVSFTLRREDLDKGSYLRFDDTVAYDASGAGGASVAVGIGSRGDYDSALRADGLQIAPLVFEEFFFDATSSCYGEVSLEWGVNIAADLDVTPQVMGVVLVYSDLGEPQTIASGTILVESTNTYTYEHMGLNQGRWAYYTLFVHYQSNSGDNYYEKAASIAVLVPFDYGSTLLLWERIPEYYRIQDTALGSVVTDELCLGTHIPVDGIAGPLFKFLSIIGFDMDRIRTIIDYTMQSKDPFLANSETLDAIADMLAVEMRSNDLGGARLRSLINDIGYFRRSKGTQGSIEFFAKAVSGCDILVDQDNKEITIYSQRVNYITSPQDGGVIVHQRAASPVEEDPDTAHTYVDTFYAAHNAEVTYSATVITSDTQAAMIHIDSPVPCHIGDHVVFSVASGVGTSCIKWVRVVDAANHVMGVSDVQTTIEGATAFEVTIDSAASVSTWTNGYIELYAALPEVEQMNLTSLMAERNYKGGYFDGSTVRGGWLVDSSSVSDYRWASSANASVSLYTEDYERTKAILDALLFEESFPITQADDYTIIVYNGVPGF